MAGKSTATAVKIRPALPEPGDETPPAGESSGDTIKVNRFGVNTRADGRVAWDSATDKTKERLRIIVNDPELPAQLGVAKPAAAGGEQIPPEMVGVVYDALAMVMKAAAQRMGYTADAAGVLGFSPEEKAALTPPTVAVLAKYDTRFTKYREELTLGLVFSTIIAGKLALLRSGSAPTNEAALAAATLGRPVGIESA